MRFLWLLLLLPALAQAQHTVISSELPDGSIDTGDRLGTGSSGTCPSGWTCLAIGDASVCNVDASDADTWTITAASNNDEAGQCIVYKTEASAADLHLEFQMTSTISGDQGDYSGCGAFFREGTSISDYSAYTWWPVIGRARLKTDAGGAGELGQLGEFGTSLPRYLAVQYDTSDTDIRGAEGSDGATWGQVGVDVSKTLTFPLNYGFACWGDNLSTTFTLDNIVANNTLETIGAPGGGTPTLLFEEDFDSTTWYNDTGWGAGTSPALSPRFGCQGAGEVFTRVTSGDNGVTLIDGPALRGVIKSGLNCGGNPGIFMSEIMQTEPSFGETLYFRYYIAFGTNFDAQQNGKLPGFSALSSTCGSGGAPCDGTDGWSARGKSAEPCSNGNSVGLDSYVYWGGMPGTFGDTMDWDTVGCGEANVAVQGTWYCVEQMITMNSESATLGNPASWDGQLHAWVDGTQVLNRNDLLWDTSGNHPVSRVWMNLYHGGGLTAPQDMHVFWDHIAISESPIGCDL